jgi:phospholipid-binding lipoprotein MlaA
MGVAGLFDPAKSFFHLEKQEEDFGQTLGRYGMGPGFYIEWPFLGPSSFRETLGLGGDAAADPFTYLLGPWERFGARSFDYINELSLDQDTYESIIEPAIDPYLAIQDAYIQNRNKKIKE